MVRIFSVTTLNVIFSLVRVVKKLNTHSFYILKCYKNLRLHVGIGEMIDVLFDGNRIFNFDFNFFCETITTGRVIFRAFFCGAGVSLQGF